MKSQSILSLRTQVLRKKEQNYNIFHLDIRILWYSVLIWTLSIIVGGIVIIPWFYLVMPLIIAVVTYYYFRKSQFMVSLKNNNLKSQKDQIFAFGLGVSLLWFLVVIALNALEIIGPYYLDASFYYSDFRNWFLYPLILLTPAIYSLFLENAVFKRKRKSTQKFKKNLARQFLSLRW